MKSKEEVRENNQKKFKREYIIAIRTRYRTVLSKRHFKDGDALCSQPLNQVNVLVHHLDVTDRL